MVHKIASEEEFEAEVARGIVVVDFFATWCKPCVNVAPEFEKLSTRHPKVKFLKVDVTEQEEIARSFSVTSIPVFIFFQDGQRVDQVVGADIGAVESKVKALCS